MKSFDSFRRQEIALIKLNLGVVAALAGLHLVFGRTLGFPATITFVLLATRFAEQCVEWICLQKLRPPLNDRQIRVFSIASPIVAIVFAFMLTVFSDFEDAHYYALMVIPIIASGFRFSLKWVLAFMLLACVLTVLSVVIVKDPDDLSGLRELFESFTDVLVYIVVGIVVWMLSEHLRLDAVALRQHYDQMQLLQARLAKDERLAAVGRLASAIAHEIRNPVAAISSSLAVADNPDMPMAVRSEMSRIAAKEAKRLETLTSDFLSYASVKPPELRSTRVGDVLKYVSDLVAARAGESQVAVYLHCDREVHCEMDEFQVHGALLNLAMNAIEASLPASRIVIGLDTRQLNFPPAAVAMYVQSEGNAIAPKVADHIFEPFFTTKPSGTGLGLAIARNVAVAHGGKLELTENRTGCIRFTFSIPLQATPTTKTDPRSANGFRIPAAPIEQSKLFITQTEET